MPISFIFICLIMLYLVFYKNGYTFAISKIFLFSLCILLLSGFFVLPINISDTFSVNVLFCFSILVLGIETFLKTKKQQKLRIFILLVLLLGAYYLIVTLNNDNLSFLNYLPIALIVSMMSLVFIKNAFAIISFVCFGFIVVEWTNYFAFNGYIGYSLVTHTEFLNVVAIVLALLLLLNAFVCELIKIKNKNNSKLKNIDNVVHSSLKGDDGNEKVH